MLPRVKLVADVRQRGDSLLHRQRTPFVHARQQHRKFVSADTCSAGGGLHRLGQHLSHPTQQRIARSMPMLVVDDLQAIEIDGDHAQRPGTLARDAVELLDVEGSVSQLGEHIVLAQIFEISLGLLARRDVHQ